MGTHIWYDGDNGPYEVTVPDSHDDAFKATHATEEADAGEPATGDESIIPPQNSTEGLR